VTHRPVLGLLVSFLMIPQLLGASDVGCSRHGEDEKPASAATEPMAGHEHHHESPGQNTAPDEHHPSTDCCPAMNSCSSGAAIQVVENDLTSWTWAGDAPTDVATSSRSRVESPDPPPPKA